MNNDTLATPMTSEPLEFQRSVLDAFSLPPACREVFLLCDVQDFTIGEAATILGVSAELVTIRLNRARKVIDARLQIRFLSRSDQTSGTA